MNKVSMVLSAVVMLAMLVVVAPNIIAMNRGKALRNIALWLGIFAGLALIYQAFGPGSPHQLFSLPDGMTRTVPGQTPMDNPPPPEDDKGFTPPKE